MEVVEKIIVYELIDFFSDFGGFIGLFLGASCISLIDLAEPYLEKLSNRKKEKKIKQGDSIREVTCKNTNAFD